MKSTTDGLVTPMTSEDGIARQSSTTSRDKSHRWGKVYEDWFRTLRGNARNVYVALTIHADTDGLCWPSKETLGEIVGIRKDRVREALRELESSGVIVTEHRDGHSSLYRLLPVDKGGPNSGPLHNKGDTFQVSPGGPDLGEGGGPDLGPHNRPRNLPNNRPTSRARKTLVDNSDEVNDAATEANRANDNDAIAAKLLPKVLENLPAVMAKMDAEAKARSAR